MNHSDDVAHLAECSACRQRFAANVVPFDPAARRNREREFTSIAARLDRERDESADVVARYLRDTPPEEWSRLAEMPDLRNNAALEQMSEEVRRRLHRKPREALAIANLSASIAESLPPSQYPSVVLAQLRGIAWKDRASTLRYLARYDEALEAAERAEEAVASFATLEHDRAIVRLVKGLIFLHINRFEEALTIFEDCRNVFREHNDKRRYIHAGIAQGNALYDTARYAESLLLYRDVLHEAIAADDVESQARIHNNLGYCATHLNDFVQANIHFSEAVAKFTDLGYQTEVPRTQRGAGLVLIGRGQIARGLTHLYAARRDFAAAGMVEEAGLCALSIAEALIERGSDSEARALMQAAIDDFASVEFDNRAIAAIIRLRDSIDVDGATVENVRTVHDFIEGLRVADEKTF